MNTDAYPIPVNEASRLLKLCEFDLDYEDLKENFKDLTKLAAKVTGAHISLVNLIDSFTQWTVSSHGVEIDQVPREDSVCQYTIMEDDCFEVKDLSLDDRFKDMHYVTGDPNLRYYFGVPLKTDDGHNIGALCVFDKKVHAIDPEKIELLKMIGSEVLNRLKMLQMIEELKHNVVQSRDAKLKVAHDIRGPLSGIIGLAKIIGDKGDLNKLEDVLQFIGMIQKSGSSILDLADEILSEEKTTPGKKKNLQSNEFNLLLFKDKLEKLYQPQALNKQINFTVNATSTAEETPFLKNKLLQIAGNIISNAIKFTPEKGTVTVDLDLIIESNKKTLHIVVKDSGVGLSQESISKLISGDGASTNGTGGEQGYGFGLVLVKHLIDTLKGTMKIYSKPGEGATFDILLPQML